MRNQNIKDMKRDVTAAARNPFSFMNDFSKDVKRNLAFAKDQINACLNQLAELNAQKKTKAVSHQAMQTQSRLSSK